MNEPSYEERKSEREDESERESIKLIKNTKGYFWEIKLKEEQVSDSTINRLVTLDKQLKDRFATDVVDTKKDY